LAVQAPQRVSSLVLWGPLTCPSEAARPNIQARGDKVIAEGVAGLQQIADAVVLGGLSEHTRANQPAVVAAVRESVMRQPPLGYGRSCHALAAAQSAALETIELSTLLITGRDDGVAPPADVAAMAERLGAARAVVLEDCGHWATLEQPAACMSLLDEFLLGILPGR
jgi:3-oxoadipate enol-lactonase